MVRAVEAYPPTPLAAAAIRRCAQSGSGERRYGRRGIALADRTARRIWRTTRSRVRGFSSCSQRVGFEGGDGAVGCHDTGRAVTLVIPDECLCDCAVVE